MAFKADRDDKSWTIPYYNKWDGSTDEGKKLIYCILILAHSNKDYLILV